MDKLLKLAALLEKYWPLIEKALPGLIAQLEKQKDNFDPGEVIPEPPAPPPVVTPPTPVLRGLTISLQWVNGQPHSLVDAIGWGSYCRFDVTRTEDQFGRQLVEADLPHPVEWFWSWDGAKGGGPVNKGAKAYDEAKGYACAFRVFDQNDGGRHKFAVWCKVAGVESNEITLDVD